MPGQWLKICLLRKWKEKGQLYKNILPNGEKIKCLN